MLPLLFLAAQAAAPPPASVTPAPRPEPWWQQRLAEKQFRLQQGDVDLAFYGDSITQDWESSGAPAWQDFQPVWARYYGARHAVNLGFGGDTTANLLWRIEHGEAGGIAPKVAVVMIGTNNLFHPDWSVEDDLAGITADVTALRRHLPKTRILLLAILPSARPPPAARMTAAINQALAKRYAGDPAVHFLDLGALFLRNGQVDPTQFLDPLKTPPEPALHPTAQAQARMAAAMEPELSRLLGDR